jgi:hypothetical protein
MKQILLRCAVAGVLTFVLGCSAQRGNQPPESLKQEPRRSPFSISVVPSESYRDPFGREITMARKLPGDFYVVLTNISEEPQATFERWNSWGYQAVSFEIQTANGDKVALSKRPQLFTKNYPSIFIIPPGEHMVYPISLDEEWDAVPPLPMTHATPMPITIKAIYEVSPTPQSAEWKVWTGRLESKNYDFKLNHR